MNLQPHDRLMTALTSGASDTLRDADVTPRVRGKAPVADSISPVTTIADRHRGGE